MGHLTWLAAVVDWVQGCLLGYRVASEEEEEEEEHAAALQILVPLFLWLFSVFCWLDRKSVV